jgi:hypothetical protein
MAVWRARRPAAGNAAREPADISVAKAIGDTLPEPDRRFA